MSKKLKYWLITSEYPPVHGGGISTYAYHTAQMLAENNIEVKVFIHDFSVNNTKINKEENISVIRFGSQDSKYNSFLGFEANVSMLYADVLKEFINKEGKPDYIETQDYQGIGYYLLQRKMLLEDCFQNIPVILTMHAPSFLYLEYNQAPTHSFPEYWMGEMEKASIKSADILISPSRFLVDKLKTQIDFNNKEIHIIKNPYKSDFSSINNHFKENEIVFFGKLTSQKGCLEMMEYFKKLWDSGFEHKLRIIGGGDHYFYPKQMDMIEYFKKKYSEYFKNGKIVFEGSLKPIIAKEKLKNAHIVLVPSIVDNFPYVVLEAMSLGKIVLGSTDSGHVEIIDDGENGFLFSHNKANDFSEKLKNILNLPKEEIIKIGQNAAESVVRKTNYKNLFEQKFKLIKSYNQTEDKEFCFINNIKKEVNPKSISNDKMLTVLIPHYNLGKYIEDAVKSVLNSDLKAEKIIVVDDGSSDKESLSILQNLEANYDIEVIFKENQGLPLTRNYVAKLVKTEFMAFLDADDMVEKSYYKKAVNILSKYSNVSFVGCWAQYFGESNDIWPAFNPEPPYILYHNSINSSALVYKTSDFIEAGQNKAKMLYGMEDYESVISMTSKGFRGVVIPEVLWNYRIRTNSMAQAFNKNSKIYLYKLIADEHKEFFSEYSNELLKLINANGPGYDNDNPTKKVLVFNGYNLPFLNSGIINKVKRVKFLRKIAKVIYKRISN